MTLPVPSLRQRRIVGIDLARFVAILGMMAAHLLSPLGYDSGANAVERLLGKMVAATVGSTAATTFAVLGGISLVLLSRSMRGSSKGRMLLSILLRGILIALIGVMLDQLGGPISVVLTFYGVAMVIAAPALLLPSWAVGGIASILWLVGGAVNAHVRAGPYPLAGTGWADDVFTRLRELLLTGHYPAITWVAYMLTGILVARMVLAASAHGTLRRLTTRLAIAGFAVYAVVTVGGRIVRMRPSWFSLPDIGEIMLSSGGGAPIGTDFWMLLIPTPHSGTPADMLRTVAGACFVIGLLVLLVDARQPRTGFALETVRAAGAAPLTIYTAHVIVTGVLHDAARRAVFAGQAVPPVWYDRGLVILLLQLLGALAIGAVLAALHRRGPLEALLGWVSGSSRRR